MNERQWEFYRLSVVEGLPDSPLKRALLGAIQHKLTTLDSFEEMHASLSDEGM
jgi:hypothetical protein